LHKQSTKEEKPRVIPKSQIAFEPTETALKSFTLSALHRMVETDTDQTNVNKSDVKTDSVRQINGVGARESSTPAIIQTNSGALVPFTTAGDKTQISREEQYRPFDPERGNAVTQSFHQLSLPFDSDGPSRADFETAIEQTGYGKFHYILLGICGLVSTSEEMDVISMSFILPSAQCDLDLNTHTKGWLNCIIFVGMMFGAYFWGSLADSLGRKKVLIVISFGNALCIVASSFSQNYELFMLFRFLNGAALGGAGPVIWSYFAEFQPKHKRGSMLSFMAAFWTIGNLLVASLAWLIIPTDIGFESHDFVYNSWRIFLVICSLPSFIVAILLMYLPESPKFLLSCGRFEEALAIFRGIYVTNTGNDASMYPVKELLIDDQLRAELEDVKKPIKNKYKRMFADIADNSKQLFQGPILKFTIVSITINLTFHIGYYGLMMWFPEVRWSIHLQ
jgi:MFS transporter, VNT family, synaptic vesicle glycoprotein 2